MAKELVVNDIFFWVLVGIFSFTVNLNVRAQIDASILADLSYPTTYEEVKVFLDATGDQIVNDQDARLLDQWETAGGDTDSLLNYVLSSQSLDAFQYFIDNQRILSLEDPQVSELLSHCLRGQKCCQA